MNTLTVSPRKQTLLKKFDLLYDPTLRRFANISCSPTISVTAAEGSDFC